MANIEKNDVILMDFSVFTKEKQLFDTTNEKIAREHNIFDPKKKYNPIMVRVGKKDVVEGLDEELIGKEKNKDYTIELSAEKAFGKRKKELMKIIPLSTFKKHNLNPFPGLNINVDGNIGQVRSVSGGRVLVDFNHALAGKNVIYNYKVNEIYKEVKEKLDAFFKLYQFTPKEIQVEDKKIKIKINKQKITKDIIKQILTNFFRDEDYEFEVEEISEKKQEEKKENTKEKKEDKQQNPKKE